MMITNYLLVGYTAFPGVPISSASQECLLLLVAGLSFGSYQISGKYSWYDLAVGMSAGPIGPSAQLSNSSVTRNKADRLAPVKSHDVVHLQKL